MARPPLLQLSGIRLSFGGDPLLDGIDLAIQPGDRLALIGRNGSGKSTLMKLMAGLAEPDSGDRANPAGIRAAYMEQDPDLSAFATLGDFAAAGLDEDQRYLLDQAAEGLGFDPFRPAAVASGGERRRAALAKLLAGGPELLLLDEPTNHLDIAATLWLERTLADTRAAFVLISHDRAFLSTLSRGLLWLDRGILRRLDRPFAEFEDWRDTTWAEEDLSRHKLDRKIRAEAKWAVEGISARRKRNQGRVRALAALRAGRAAETRRQGTASLALDSGPVSGRLVIEAKGISKDYDGKLILRPFDLTILRGDRIAFVGPNGAGKTTLLRILAGDIPPDSGTLRHGTNLQVAVFDQARAALDPAMTLWDGLVNDPGMRVSGRADQVMVRGEPKHVVAYLKDFLFDEARARAPIGSLSGGERARLLLARIMAQPSNLLILDEPTNDLDVETLDLLQDVLAAYDGTVLLVSHDRDFIDRMAGLTVAFEGAGRLTVYPGGWSDYVRQRGAALDPEERPPKGPAPPAAKPAAGKGRGETPPKRGLSFTERHRLETLPATIARIEAEIAKLSALLSDPNLYRTAPEKARKAAAALAERQDALRAAEEDWLALAEREGE
ncbi:MAG: ABC-F family ATP-binding cassette domain-containing protein [Paracoccaceae bacterium]